MAIARCAVRRIKQAVDASAPPSRAQYIGAKDAAANLAVARQQAGMLLGVAIETFRQALVKREEIMAATRDELADATQTD